jgi:transposase
MDIKLHVNATTTPRIRSYIQSSNKSVAALSKELGISEPTVRKWRKRTMVCDRSHRPHQLHQSTSLEEEVIIEGLRRDVGLSLDDLVEVMHRCVNNQLSRSSIYRCLKRQGLSSWPKSVDKPVQRFDETPFGFVHIDLKHLTRLKHQRSYVFVAIERTTRFVYVEVIPQRDAETISGCLDRFIEAFGYPVHTILTDNGSEFTDRFAVDKKGKPDNRPSGDHPFDQLCQANGIKHRLTRPYRPQTNGMVERFNRRLSEALRQATPSSRNGGKNRFDTHEHRNRFIHDLVYKYNRTRLKCLGYKAPLEALNNQTEYNTCAGMTRK